MDRRRRNGSGGSIFPKSDKEGRRHAAVATATRSIDLGPLPPPAGSVCLSALRLPSSLCVLRVRSGCVRACRICIRVSRAHTHASPPRRTIRHRERGLGTATEERRREQTETAWIQWQRTHAHGRAESLACTPLPSLIHPSIHPLSK